jgi:hypothetical protein
MVRREGSMITEKLLFAVHRGTVAGEPAGIIMEGHCLPLACSHSSWEGTGAPVAEDGIYALWEATGDVEEFFGELGITHIRQINDFMEPNGLLVYEVSYDAEMPLLRYGDVRRPTPDELAPLSHGGAPWGGVVL